MILNREWDMKKQLLSELEELLRTVSLSDIEEDVDNITHDGVKQLLYFLMEAKNELATSVIYRADGIREIISPNNGKHFQLEELQEIVGGYIEVMNLPTMEKKMVLNEDGRSMELPINRLATALFRDAYATSEEVLIKWGNNPAIKHQFSVEKMKDITPIYNKGQVHF